MECCSPEFCSAWSVWVYSCVERPWKLALAALLARLLSSSERSPGPRESSTLAVQSFPAAHFSFPPFLCWLVQQCCSRPAPWPAKRKIWPSRISPQILGWLYGGEALTLKVGIAAALVVGAVVLVDRGTNKLNRLA